MPLHEITEAPANTPDPITALISRLPSRVEVANLVFDTVNKQVCKSGPDTKLLPLRPKEYDVLLYLAVCALNSQIANKDKLFGHLYGELEMPPEEQVVKVYIWHIRKKLAAQNAECHIETMHRKGFALKAGPAPAES